MGHKESGQGDCAIGTVKSMGWLDMVLESPVQPFHELFEGPVGYRLAVEVLESDDLAVGKILLSLGI